jgi:hypothetical protein
MPILTAQCHLVSILTGLPLPGFGGSTLQVFVIPPDPETEETEPTAYIWPATGPEKRQTITRPQQGTPGTGGTNAGWKEMEHHFDVFLTWFQFYGDVLPDQSFPVIVDAVMDAFRCTTDPVLVQDPVTFRYSQLYAIGEKMDYEIAVPMSTAQQRTLKHGARVTVNVGEEFQA